MSGLTIHHLRLSQSERITWLCEELEIPYTLKCYNRQPPTLQAPDEYRKLHWSGTAPIIEDNGVALGETMAIIEYILTKYGKGRLVLSPDHPKYADYVFWLHRAQGSTMPSFMGMLFSRIRGTPSEEDFVYKMSESRVKATCEAMEQQLAKNAYLAGEEFTAADCVSVFHLTTLRLFVPYSLEEYPHIVRYLERIGQRPAYKRAMEKGDPDLVPLLAAAAPAKSLL
ncbi:glutathione S-transferase family protein [Aspergillus neoniger CBS 115656]|uniref:Glutathione S-transferase n=1 Tax=Aspergillus neoniger (strain CBS 115656) TaxID=1448310 RepID=A0A318YBG6_ASPNB|nr:glutathione S-transferase [Aspergillus neoniger CBS 115656]PYH31681.1 glutathione S-transferase [Aspergillus neoniger CBS 115656]